MTKITRRRPGHKPAAKNAGDSSAADKHSHSPTRSPKTRTDFRRPGESLGTPYESFLAAMKIVQSGLPVTSLLRLQKASGLTLDQIKRAAKITEGSFARRKKTGRFSSEESERLVRVSRVFERAFALFDGSAPDARQWLETKIPSLGNLRPLDLAQTEAGAREVEDLVGRIEYGVVS
jgi:putative toxin-antitoxin system antitoxin component (TIGR02293 family)